jgi:hypothetical protein
MLSTGPPISPTPIPDTRCMHAPTSTVAKTRIISSIRNNLYSARTAPGGRATVVPTASDMMHACDIHEFNGRAPSPAPATVAGPSRGGRRRLGHRPPCPGRLDHVGRDLHRRHPLLLPGAHRRRGRRDGRVPRGRDVAGADRGAGDLPRRGRGRRGHLRHGVRGPVGPGLRHLHLVPVARRPAHGQLGGVVLDPLRRGVRADLPHPSRHLPGTARGRLRRAVVRGLAAVTVWLVRMVGARSDGAAGRGDDDEALAGCAGGGVGRRVPQGVDVGPGLLVLRVPGGAVRGRRGVRRCRPAALPR